MVDIIEIENDSLRSNDNSCSVISPFEQRKIVDNCIHSSLNSDCKGYGKIDAFHHKSRNISNDRDPQDITHITDGDAIVSKYGTENVGFEEGISFSYASSVFFSSMAQADATNARDKTASSSSSSSLICKNQGNAHQIHQPVAHCRKPGAPKQSIVNPYLKETPKNNSNSMKCKRSLSSNSDLKFGLSWQRTGENRNTQIVNPKSSSSIPISKSPSLSSSLMGGVDVDFGDGSCNREQQKSTYEQHLSTHKQYEKNVAWDLLHHHGFEDQDMQSSQRQLEMKGVPFTAPALYPIQRHQAKALPVLKELNMKTRPKTSRKTMRIRQLFSPPVSNFWSEKYESFNHMQSEVAGVLVYSDENVVVGAPTGAGKTAVFEMAIGRLLTDVLKQEKCIDNMNYKIVYISPSKALCDERLNDWSQCLQRVHSNLKCVVATGDRLGSSSICTLQELSESTLILTTPEKWDSITRNWTDNTNFLASVKLLLIDEVHLLGDENRGGCLESVICRMKTIQQAIFAGLACSTQSNSSTTADIPRRGRSVTSKPLRIVSLSATLPNIKDIASFIGAGISFSFDSSFRPVPLTTHVIGLYYSGKNLFMFDKNMGKEIPGLLRRFSNGKPAIVFCHTKKQTETLAQELISTYGSSNHDAIIYSKQTNLCLLRKCLEKGIAYHHSGMESECRQLVERAFVSGTVKCLCATSTLAMGVNLPAHLVIIKGTKVWRGAKDGYQDIDSGTLLQMMGRAGRAGFDETGTAIILTDKKSKTYYERITLGLDVVESNLLNNLTESLNTEISQRVISDIESGIKWLMDTFLFVRAQRNPQRYGVTRKSTTEVLDMKEYLSKICNESVHDLHQNGIIAMSGQGIIEPRIACQIMSRHLVPFSAMKLIIRLPYNSSEIQILHMLSKLEGLHFPVRRAEKSKLNAAHKAVKYKLDSSSKFRIKTSEQKAFVLLQCAIGQHYLDDYTLRQEMSLTVEFASRMLLAAEDYYKEESKHGQVIFKCMVMRRCLATSLWSSNDGVLNQIVGVGHMTTAKLLANGIKTFDDVISVSGSDIEEACGRDPPFGQELRVAASKLLARRLQVKTNLKPQDKMQRSVLTCDISFRDDTPITDTASADFVKYSLVVYADCPGGLITFEPDIVRPGIYRMDCPSDCCRLRVRLISNIVGLDTFTDIGGEEDNDKCSQVSLTPPIKRRTRQSGNRNETQAFTFSCEGGAGKPLTLSDFQDTREEIKAKLFHNIVTPSSSSMNAPGLATNQAIDTAAKTKNSVFRGNRYKMVNSRKFDTSRGMKNVWQRQRRELQKTQQRAFSSQKDNPFSSFQYDPNDCEKQLVEHSRVLHDDDKDKNLLQSSENQAVQRKRSFQVSQHRVSKGWCVSGQSYSKRCKSLSSGPSMRLQDLLHLKAQEQEAYTKELIDNSVTAQTHVADLPNIDNHPHSKLGQKNANPSCYQSSLWPMQNPQFLHECETNNGPILGLQVTPLEMEKEQALDCFGRQHHSQRMRSNDDAIAYNPYNAFSPNIMFDDVLTKGDLEDSELMPESERESIRDCYGLFQEDISPQGMVITVKSGAVEKPKCLTSFPNEFDDAFVL